MSLAIAFHPPSMTREDAALARAFACRRVPLQAGGWAAEVVPPGEVPDPVHLAISLAGRPAAVAVPRPLLDGVLALLDPAAPMAPPDLAALLLELALEPLLDQLAAAAPALADPLTVLDAAAAGGSDLPFALGLACRAGGLSGVIRLDLDLAAAQEVARLLGTLRVRRVRLPELPVPLSLRVMATTLTLGGLRGLGQGDVVLPDGLADGEVLLVAGERLVWRAHRDVRMVQVASGRLRPRAAGLESWMMDDAAGLPDDAALEDLPVRLAFELGRIEVPLGELEAIGPGHVFELGRDPGQAVDLVANGRRIGRGRLVEVAGSIGVQVVWIGRDG